MQPTIVRLIFLGTGILTCGTHCILGWKIWRKKRTLSYLGNGASHPPKIFWLSHPKPPQVVSEESSLLDNVSSAIFLVFFILMMVASSSLFLLFMGGLPLALVARMAMLSFVLLINPLSVYVRKPHIRTVLARELRELLQCS